MKKRYIIPIFVPHQGCIHSCVFCNQKKITGQHSQLKEETLYQTIQRQLSRYKSKAYPVEIAFYGGSFTCIPHSLQKKYLDTANHFIEHGAIDGIRISTRPDGINQEIMEFLIENRVKTIELGVQSMNPYVLRMAERGHTDQDVIRAVHCIRAYPISLGLQMMVGLPGEDRLDPLLTAWKITKLSPDFVRVYPTVVLENTSLQNLYINGEYRPLCLKDAVSSCALIKILFERYKIPVIRMGLQVTEEINTASPSLIAGPFHPAFGELVENEIWLNLILHGLHQMHFLPGETAEIQVHPSNYSKTIGNGRQNTLHLGEAFPGSHLIFRQNNRINQDEVIIMKNFDERNFSKSLLFSIMVEGILREISNSY